MFTEANNVFSIFEQELTKIMAEQGGSASRVAVDPHEAILSDLVSDAKNVVAHGTIRVIISLAMSDASGDDDISKDARLVKDMTKVEETRLNGARARLS